MDRLLINFMILNSFCSGYFSALFLKLPREQTTLLDYTRSAIWRVKERPAMASLEGQSSLSDWNLPLSFMKNRHKEKIEGIDKSENSWRMKDRVSVKNSSVTRWFISDICALCNNITACSFTKEMLQINIT